MDNEIQARKRKIASLIEEHAKVTKRIRWYQAFWTTEKTKTIKDELDLIEYEINFHRMKIKNG